MLRIFSRSNDCMGYTDAVCESATHHRSRALGSKDCRLQVLAQGMAVEHTTH